MVAIDFLSFIYSIESDKGAASFPMYDVLCDVDHEPREYGSPRNGLSLQTSRQKDIYKQISTDSPSFFST